MKPIVFDTNTLISALLIKTSISRRAFDKALDEYQLLLATETVLEFYDVISRDKFAKYLDEDDLEDFLDLLHREARFVEIDNTIQASRDVDDDKFLALALAGHAEVIVTGDKDLLTLDPFHGVRIVTPGIFVTELPGSHKR